MHGNKPRLERRVDVARPVRALHIRTAKSGRQCVHTCLHVAYFASLLTLATYTLGLPAGAERHREQLQAPAHGPTTEEELDKM